MKKVSFKRFLPFILLLIIIAVMVLYLFNYFTLEMDDDNSAEMVLSWILYRDGGVISKDWIYSTEIRVINIQIVYSFLFNFFTNWLTVRVVGNGIMYLFLTLSVFYLCSQLNIKHHYTILGTMFILPVCRDYYVYTIHSAYMLPHIILSIFVIALFLHSIHAEGKQKIIILIIGGVVSFCAGLGGIRLLFMVFMPLFLSVVIYLIIIKSTKEMNILINAVIMSCLASLGYALNNFYLIKVYSNNSINNFAYSLFQFENVIKVFNAFLKNYGWHYGSNFFSIQTFYNILPVLMIMTIIVGCRTVLHRKSSFNKEQILLTLFYISGLIIFTLLYSLSNMILYDRYFLPITIYGYFISIFVMDSVIPERLRKLIWGLFFFYYIILCMRR